MAGYEVVFYEDENKRQPFRQFLKDLDRTKELAMIAAIEQILAEQGPNVCRSSWGKQLGEGLFEFRVRHTREEIRRMFDGDPLAEPGEKEGPPGKVLLRAFCHAYGNKVVLLLGGYDKGGDASAKRQQLEIATARKRLRAFQATQRAAAKKPKTK